jgi:hypothetical protein
VSGALRALGGALAAGLVVLALLLVGAAFLAGDRGVPGPGAGTITVHVLGAAAAVGLQRWSDRRADPAGAVAAAGVVLLSGVVLAAQWLV